MPKTVWLMQRALIDAGFIVSEAPTAAEGIEAAQQTTPDCILLGTELPDKEGLAVLAQLVPDPTAPRVAVVMLIGAAGDEQGSLAIKSGAQDYLTKSRLEPYDLSGVIRKAVGRLKLIVQRLDAEQELADSEACYRSIVEDQTEMISRFRADGTLTFVNAAYARALGRTPAQLIDTSLYKLVPDVERTFIRNAIARLTPRNPVVTHRHRAFSADGSICWQEWSNRLLPGQKGKPDEYQGTGRDITARKAAEDALRESEARFRGIFENAAVGMARVALDGSWLEVNDQLCEITGYTRDELLAKTFQDITHPGDLEADLDYLRKLLAGEISRYSVDKRYIRKDGGIVWIALTVTVQRDALGVPLYFISIVRDITERKEAEEALRESEERFRIITTTAQEGIWSLDRDGKILFVNPRMAELLGAHPEEMIGKPVNEFCFPEDHAAMQERIAANLAGERIEFEFRFRRRDGAPLYLLAATSPLHGSRGEVIGALGGFLNLAERKAAEDHQRFLMRELSHRSKNLLAIIQAMASQTARSATSLADFQERFSQRLQGIAASHDVLVSQNWAGAPLADLIRQHLDPFMEAGASRLRLEGPAVSLKPEAAQALGLAIHELATNSVKYGALSRPDGKVTVAWTFEEKGAEGRRLRLDWQERGGPRVAPPARKGFGHAVINRMVAQSLDGTVKLDFAPEGLSWSLSIPATYLAIRGCQSAEHARANERRPLADQRRQRVDQRGRCRRFFDNCTASHCSILSEWAV